MKVAKVGRGGARVGAGRPKGSFTVFPRPQQSAPLISMSCGVCAGVFKASRRVDPSPNCPPCNASAKIAGANVKARAKRLAGRDPRGRSCECGAALPEDMRIKACAACVAAARVARVAKGNAWQRERIRSEKLSRPPLSCAWCAQEFRPDYGCLQSRYCSLDCRRCSRNEASAGNTHARRARSHGVTYEKIDRRAIFERDGWACRICGVPTPEELLGTTSDRKPTLDHVTPFALGGEHVRQNLQCACLRCNLRKGAKPSFRLAA